MLIHDGSRLWWSRSVLTFDFLGLLGVVGLLGLFGLLDVR
jgi:hypothetical protein